MAGSKVWKDLERLLKDGPTASSPPVAPLPNNEVRESPGGRAHGEETPEQRKGTDPDKPRTIKLHQVLLSSLPPFHLHFQIENLGYWVCRGIAIMSMQACVF